MLLPCKCGPGAQGLGPSGPNDLICVFGELEAKRSKAKESKDKPAKQSRVRREGPNDLKKKYVCELKAKQSNEHMFGARPITLSTRRISRERGKYCRIHEARVGSAEHMSGAQHMLVGGPCCWVDADLRQESGACVAFHAWMRALWTHGRPSSQ